jgi:hypothetical protein
MRGRDVGAIALLLAVLGACTPGATSPPQTAPPVSPPAGTPAPVVGGTDEPRPTDGPERLVGDIRASGVDARLGPLFSGDPITAVGVVVCVGAEPVQLYVFGSVAERIALTATVDPDSPSNLGTAMITWNGRPRMWERDRLLVVYLGEDADTEARLRGVLGEPFAVAQEGPPQLRDDSCG